MPPGSDSSLFITFAPLSQSRGADANTVTRRFQTVDNNLVRRKNKFLRFLVNHIQPLMIGSPVSSVTLESRRELRKGSVPDGKLPAGNHRQFRCYCPLEPLKKACILT